MDEGSIWLVGDGTKIDIWESKCLSNPPSYKVFTLIGDPPPIVVASIID